MKKFCITGGIACGKSAVAARLSAAGWRVIDADAVAHEQLAPDSEGWKKVVDAFGKSIINDARSVNRTLLGKLVFADAAKRNVLNSILHPLVYAALEQRWREHQRNQPAAPAVTVIPLLHETGGEGWFDSVACAASSSAVQMARLRGRGLSEEEARQRVAAQMTVEEKVRRSGMVIWNNGSLALLNRQVELLKNLWLNS